MLFASSQKSILPKQFNVPLEINQHTMVFKLFSVGMSTDTGAAAQLHAESYCTFQQPLCAEMLVQLQHNYCYPIYGLH